MITLHPEILNENGKQESVVLPDEEFIQLQRVVADAEDLLSLRAAKAEESDAPTVSSEGSPATARIVSRRLHFAKIGVKLTMLTTLTAKQAAYLPRSRDRISRPIIATHSATLYSRRLCR